MSEAKPQIIVPDLSGYHNKNFTASVKRIEKSKSYQDLSTIIITPCFNSISVKIVQNWLGIMKPMNQKSTHIFVQNMEVGKAYSETIEMILAHPELSTWRYIFCLEHDNLVPPDILLKLYPDMEEYDAVESLYWTKGIENSQPQCYGKPNVFPVNMIPFLPQQNSVTRCMGLGMGATMFKLSMFKDKRLPRPLFETVQNYQSGVGAQVFTQDLKYFSEAGKLGYKFACSTKVLTGHYSESEDFVY